MENAKWTTKYQQSVPTNPETENHLNNGTTENGEDGECSIKSDKEDLQGLVKNDLPEDSVPINITISEKAKQTIESILELIKPLSQVEKFLLFLKLSAEVSSSVDPFRQPLNPLGSRSEITRTISWIKTHLEEDPDISLPKQEVYNEYHNYCGNNGIKPLSQADFGKVMKQVYPRVRARRLGTRGNSRYCYSGLRRCAKLRAPVLPNLADKPMSTEAPFTQSNLTSAAWLIVKQWSEQQLKQEFVSIQSLAYFLIMNQSIATGTEAASRIINFGDSSLKEESNGKTPNKLREVHLQLQKKIQQKERDNKERKKRTQSPKCEQKPIMKKSRSQSVPVQNISSNFSPTNGGSSLIGNGGVGECSSSTAGSSSSTSTSPTQAKNICDKSLDLTQLPVLPDFNSFQKPAADGSIANTGQESQLMVRSSSKVRISQLVPSNVQSCPSSSSNSTVPPLPTRKTKYKSHRPRLQQCDIASYNSQPLPQMNVSVSEVEDKRSQLINDIGRIKESNSDEECDVPDFPLTRERINSVSNVSKDAMDEYLGTNNSQHEEELSKYFSNNSAPEPTESEDTSKLSTLRQLLVQNFADTKPPVSALFDNRVLELKNVPITNNQIPVQINNNYITPLTPQQANIITNIKRRVSFETPEDSVPASPNTRRKNFSFTPISPGPQSPSGVHSKCSSTSASPFVSPRNTPVLRNKPAHSSSGGILKNEVRKTLRVKREIDLTVDIPSETLFPVVHNNSNKSVLQKLLNSTSKVQYNPSYTSLRNLPIQTDNLPDATPFLNSNVESNLEGFRSKSVPLHNMIAPVEEIFTDSNEFSEIDPIPESDTDNVKQILKSLDDITATNVNLREYGLQFYNSNIDINNYPPERIMRSQSIGNDINTININQNALSVSIPSRSVPSTPLPFIKPTKINYNNSRSYPSTPLNSIESFTYNVNVNGDCLLNGQPIRSDNVLDNMDLNFGMNGNESADQQLPHDIGDDFDMVENDSQLINPSLIQTNFIGNIE